MDESYPPASYTESKAGTIIGVSVAFAATSLVILLLRLFVRVRILKAAGLDDWTMLAAQLLAVVISITTSLETRYGLGRHIWAAQVSDTLGQMRFLYINIILYNLTMNVIKISFLLQYYRIFQSTTYRRLCIGMMTYVAVWAVVQGTLLGLACVPISYIVPSTADWCLSTLPIWYFSSAMNMATDTAIFMIPLPSVVRLQLPRRQKIVVFGVFCLGFFVCVVSVIRILTLRVATNTQDPTWDNTGAAIWSVIEMNCAILCSTLPTLRPLFTRKARELKSSMTSLHRVRSSANARGGGGSHASHASHLSIASIASNASNASNTNDSNDDILGDLRHFRKPREPRPVLYAASGRGRASRADSGGASSSSDFESGSPGGSGGGADDDGRGWSDKVRPDMGVYTDVFSPGLREPNDINGWPLAEKQILVTTETTVKGQKSR